MVPLIHCDSNGALSTIRSTIMSDKAKHIDTYCAHSIGLRLRYSRAHGIGLRSRAHGIGLRSHTHGIGSSRSCLDKRFLHLRGSDIHAETKSLSFFIGFIGFMSLSLLFSRCTALFFLLRVSPTGFTAEVLMRPLGLYVFHFFFILYGVSLCRSVLLACLLPRSAARGEVLQYLTRSALSRVESRYIRVFRLFTFPAFLSKTRQYTQDFIVPSNFHHNLDTRHQIFRVFTFFSGTSCQRSQPTSVFLRSRVSSRTRGEVSCPLRHPAV